jgi:hypothetical protein
MRNTLIARVAGCFTIVAIFGFICGSSVAQTEPSAPPAIVAMTADELPDAALPTDLLMITCFDFKTGDKTAWTNAWLTISGGKPTTQPVADNAPLPIGLDGSIGPMIAMGAERVCYTLSIENGNKIVTLCVQLRPGASDAAALKWLRNNARNATKFEHDGPWLVVRINGSNGNLVSNTGAHPLNPNADVLRQALNCWGDDVPVKTVLTSSDSIKKQLMRNGPPPAVLGPIANLYWSARYIYVGAKLGSNPQIEARWVAPDEAGADQVIKSFNTLRTSLKQPDNELHLPAAFAAILDQFQPTRDANIASVSMDRKQLSTLFASVVAASMNANSRNTRASAPAQVGQQPVSPDWKPIDAATDSAMAQMRLILTAITEYDQDHQSLPNSLDDLVSANLLPGPEILRDPRSTSGKSFVYVKPAAAKLADVPDHNKTAILLEDKEVQANERGLVGYADGHVDDAPQN